MTESFAEKTKRESDEVFPDHLLWTASLNGFSEPRMRVQGVLQNARQVAYKLEEPEMPWGTLVLADCENVRCVDYRCLRVAQPEDVAPRCLKGHVKVDDWYFLIAGQKLCRGCQAYWSVSLGIDRQFEHVAGKLLAGSTPDEDREDWFDLFQAEINSRPGMIQAEAPKVLADYLRKYSADKVDQARVSRLTEHARGSFMGLHSSDWNEL
jgi:hypothetical protein